MLGTSFVSSLRRVRGIGVRVGTLRPPLQWFPSHIVTGVERAKGSHRWKGTSSDSTLAPVPVRKSLTEKLFRFSSDEGLRSAYTSVTGHTRIGLLLGDMDIIAGDVCYSHSDGYNASRRLTIVTARCDRIRLHKGDGLDPSRDLRMVGSMAWVGNSSMEVEVQLKQQHSGSEEWTSVVSGYFLMVSRDYSTYKAARVNPLLPETPEEIKKFEEGAARNQKNRQERQHSLHEHAPSTEETALIHKLYKEREMSRRRLESSSPGAEECGDNVPVREGEKKKRAVSPDDTYFEATKLMHPARKNVHGKVFGGYIMREAFELGYLTACNFAKRDRVRFVMMDDIIFLEPVEIGQVLSFGARVVYTAESKDIIQVMVTADVIRPTTGSRTTTNTFHFTFASDNLDTAVNPRSYREAIMLLEGRRRAMSLDLE